MVFLHRGSYGWGRTSDPIYDRYNLINKYSDITRKIKEVIDSGYDPIQNKKSNMFNTTFKSSQTEISQDNSQKNMYNTQITIAGKQTTLISEYSKITENSPIDYVYKFTGKITKYNDITGKVEEIKFTKK